MSFIAGYIAGLEEGGSEYKNEPITITSNGIYTPQSDVRFDRITVDVPQRSSGLMPIIKGLPVHASLALSDGYRIDFSVDTGDLVPVQGVRTEWGYWYLQGGGEQTIYPTWRHTALLTFSKIFRGGELLFARYTPTYGFEYNKQELYYAREGWNAYLSSKVCISDIKNMTAELEMSGARLPARVCLGFDYKKNWSYYLEGGVFDREDAEDKHDRVYINDISSLDGYQQVISDLDLAGKAKAMVGLHVALIHTKGFDVKIDISNI